MKLDVTLRAGCGLHKWSTGPCRIETTRSEGAVVEMGSGKLW